MREIAQLVASVRVTWVLESAAEHVVTASFWWQVDVHAYRGSHVRVLVALAVILGSRGPYTVESTLVDCLGESFKISLRAFNPHVAFDDHRLLACAAVD